jgi:phosphinothricin acetyltransferase
VIRHLERDVLIRDAEDKDLPRIVELVNAFILTTTTEWTESPYALRDRRKWLKQHRQANEPVIVAESSDEIAGFACYSDFRDSAKWPGYRFAPD